MLFVMGYCILFFCFVVLTFYLPSYLKDFRIKLDFFRFFSHVYWPFGIPNEAKFDLITKFIIKYSIINVGVKKFNGSSSPFRAHASYSVPKSFFTAVRTPWTSDQPVARPLSKHRTTQTHNERIYTHQTSMPWVGFEPTIPTSERSKTVHASDRVATVTGVKKYKSPKNIIILMWWIIREIRGNIMSVWHIDLRKYTSMAVRYEKFQKTTLGIFCYCSVLLVSPCAHIA
jgi:hypothetical protein